MTLGILYHMPFWRAADGSLWESEGSFARYVDSLAPFFDEVVLAVPVFDSPQATGSRVRAANVTLAPLPYFPGPRQFYPLLPSMLGRLRSWVRRCDVVHLRVPTPAGIFAFRIAQAQHKPTFLLVVGDYEALMPHLGYRGIKKFLFARYVAFEEWALRHMTARALTFANDDSGFENPVRLYGALLRATTMAGAAASLLDQSVVYVNDRVQFGRPLARFQAIQHMLAELASEAAAATMAAAAACAAAAAPHAPLEIATAKVRAGQMSVKVTRIAHQVHGAIGFTHEHDLHFATRRLWAWRSEFGGDASWAEQIGLAALRAGSAGFWAQCLVT